MDPVGFEHHDHGACISTGVEAAQKACAAKGLRFTPQRQRVLEILLEQHRALGAYDILEILRAEGATAQPPVAYRALDFLVEHGFAHKVERLNAFIACAHPGHSHAPAFLICRACRAIAEAPVDPARALLRESAQSAGFEIETTMVEAIGLCPKCVEPAS
jgi:Fur family zinc uptake transcriptional regulator